MAFYECGGGINLKNLSLSDLKSETGSLSATCTSYSGGTWGGGTKTYTCTTISKIIFVKVTSMTVKQLNDAGNVQHKPSVRFTFGGNTVSYTPSAYGNSVNGTGKPSGSVSFTVYGI